MTRNDQVFLHFGLVSSYRFWRDSRERIELLAIGNFCDTVYFFWGQKGFFIRRFFFSLWIWIPGDTDLDLLSLT